MNENKKNTEEHILVRQIIKEEQNEEQKVEKLKNIYNENKENYDLLVTLIKEIGLDKTKRKKAKEILKLLFNYADTSYVYLSLAKLEILDKNYEKAKEYINIVLSFDKNNREAITQNIRIDIKNNIFDKEKLTKVANLYNDPIASFTLAKSYEREENYNKALEYYQKVLHTKKDDAKTLFSIAKIKIKQNRIREAERILKKIIRNNPQDVASISTLAELEYQKNNIETSKTLYKQVLNIKKDGQASSNLGKIYNKEGNFEKAYNYLKIAYNNYYNCQYLLGTIAKKLGKFEESKEWFLESYQNYQTQLELSNLYAREKDLESALYYLIKAYNLITEQSDLRNFYRLETYIKKQLGILKENPKNKDSIYFKQLKNYSENLVIEKAQNLFSEKFNIQENIKYIKQNINENNYATTSGGIDYYLIKFNEEVGKKDGISTNYISVMTIIGTDKIISISPFVIYEYISTKNIRKQRKYWFHIKKSKSYH